MEGWFRAAAPDTRLAGSVGSRDEFRNAFFLATLQHFLLMSESCYENNLGETVKKIVFVAACNFVPLGFIFGGHKGGQNRAHKVTLQGLWIEKHSKLVRKRSETGPKCFFLVGDS